LISENDLILLLKTDGLDHSLLSNMKEEAISNSLKMKRTRRVTEKGELDGDLSMREELACPLADISLPIPCICFLSSAVLSNNSCISKPQVGFVKTHSLCWSTGVLLLDSSSENKGSSLVRSRDHTHLIAGMT
jgi:hypothetical protein